MMDLGPWNIPLGQQAFIMPCIIDVGAVIDS